MLRIKIPYETENREKLGGYCGLEGEAPVSPSSPGEDAVQDAALVSSQDKKPKVGKANSFFGRMKKSLKGLSHVSRDKTRTKHGQVTSLEDEQVEDSSAADDVALSNVDGLESQGDISSSQLEHISMGESHKPKSNFRKNKFALSASIGGVQSCDPVTVEEVTAQKSSGAGGQSGDSAALTTADDECASSPTVDDMAGQDWHSNEEDDPSEPVEQEIKVKGHRLKLKLKLPSSLRHVSGMASKLWISRGLNARVTLTTKNDSSSASEPRPTLQANIPHFKQPDLATHALSNYGNGGEQHSHSHGHGYHTLSSSPPPCDGEEAETVPALSMSSGKVQASLHGGGFRPL